MTVIRGKYCNIAYCVTLLSRWEWSSRRLSDHGKLENGDFTDFTFVTGN